MKIAWPGLKLIAKISQLKKVVVLPGNAGESGDAANELHDECLMRRLGQLQN
jgi:hypothetical protein